MVNALQPRGQPQQVESLDVALPLVGSIVLRILAGELGEIRNSLLPGQGFLGVDGTGGEAQEQNGKAQTTHRASDRSKRCTVAVRMAEDTTPVLPTRQGGGTDARRMLLRQDRVVVSGYCPWLFLHRPMESGWPAASFVVKVSRSPSTTQ